MFVAGRIDLQDIDNFRGGSTTDWVKGVRKVILLCALWSIHEKYCSADGSYIPFKENREDEARQLYGDN